MNPGTLNRYVEIQFPDEVQSASGEPSRTWAFKASVWANIRPMRGSELVNAQQVDAQLSHRITIRYRNDITAKWRICDGDRIFNVESVIDINDRHHMMELVCSEDV